MSPKRNVSMVRAVVKPESGVTIAVRLASRQALLLEALARAIIPDAKDTPQLLPANEARLYHKAIAKGSSITRALNLRRPSYSGLFLIGSRSLVAFHSFLAFHGATFGNHIHLGHLKFRAFAAGG